MDLGLAGRVAIVTGASRGIGKACAAELAAEGAARRPASARTASAMPRPAPRLAPQAKGRVLGAPADLNDEAAVRAVFERTMAEFGRLDILVNCAAVIGRGDFFCARRGEVGADVRGQARRHRALHAPRGAADASAQMGPHRQRARRRRASAAAGRGVGRAQQCRDPQPHQGDRRRSRQGQHPHQCGDPERHPFRAARRDDPRRGGAQPARRKRRCGRRGSPAFRSDEWGRAAKSAPSSPSSPPSARASSPAAPGRSTAALRR